MDLDFYRVCVYLMRKVYPTAKLNAPNQVYIRASSFEDAERQAKSFSKYLLGMFKGCEVLKIRVRYCQRPPTNLSEGFNRGTIVYYDLGGDVVELETA